MANDPDPHRTFWTPGNIIAMVQSVVIGIVAVISALNRSDLLDTKKDTDDIKNGQTVHIEKTDKAAVSAEKAEKKVDKLEEASLPLLYANLVYLESIYKDPDRAPDERDKARVRSQEIRNAIADLERNKK